MCVGFKSKKEAKLLWKIIKIIKIEIKPIMRSKKENIKFNFLLILKCLNRDISCPILPMRKKL